MVDVVSSAVEATRKGAFELFGKNLSIDGWSNFMPQIAGLQRKVKETCSGFNKKPLLNNGIDLRSLPLFISHDCGRFGSHLLHLRKGTISISLYPCSKLFFICFLVIDKVFLS